MKEKQIYKILFISMMVLFYTNIAIGKEPPSIIQLTHDFFEKAKTIHSLKYSLNKRERINGQLLSQNSEVKLNKKPFQIYLKQSYPKDGVEVLYKENYNDNKAIINPAGFPWVNISLDPYGKWMRDNQHHTIFDSGFDLIVSILKHLYYKYENEVQSMITYQGTDSRNGTDCHVVSCYNPHFKFIEYTIKEGENLLSIAHEKMISEHMILEANEDVDDYYDVVPGQKIIIPNDYSQKMLIYLDKKDTLPILLQVFDNKGLYEEYEYSSVTINPNFSSEEFTENYKDYGF